MCKCAVSLLTPPPVEEAEGAEEGGAGGGEDAEKEDVGGGGVAFPLDIDQEVSVTVAGNGTPRAPIFQNLPVISCSSEVMSVVLVLPGSGYHSLAVYSTPTSVPVSNIV